MIGPDGMKIEGGGMVSGFDAESLKRDGRGRNRGRVCGMRRRWFWLLMVVLGLCIVGAVVVPVVLVLVPKGAQKTA
jgi:hypothetical protein